MTRPLARVATCALNQWSLDFVGNRDRIIESIRIAKSLGARVRVGPELEVSGYSCQDHFNEHDTLFHSWQVLTEILTADGTDGIFILVGMPIMHKSVTYNCAVAAVNGKILLIRPKMMMCDNGNYRESRYFTGWKKLKVEEFPLPYHVQVALGQQTVPIGDAVIQLNDTTVGIEICEEMWNLNSPHVAMALDGVEIFLHPSASYHELRKAHVVVDHLRECTLKCGGVYAYANLLGCDGDRLYFNSNIGIASNGEMLVQGPQFGIEDVVVRTATIDLEDVRTYRNRWRSSARERATTDEYPRVHARFTVAKPQMGAPTRPIQWQYHSPAEEIMLGPASYLWDYLRRSNQGGFFLPLSGGRDSASVACIVFSMCNLVFDSIKRGDEKVLKDLRKAIGSTDYSPQDARDICGKLLHTCYLGTENSSDDTKNAANALATQIGCSHSSLVIDEAVQGVLNIFEKAIGKTPKYRAHGGSPRENLALQNIQARERMVISYFFAQTLLWAKDRPAGLLVLATANVDESLFGYMTKYDCSSGDINPIGSISKKDLDMFLRHMRDLYGLDSLDSIMEATPTAELEPLQGGKYVQSDEADMGLTYAELAELGELRKPGYYGPYSMFCKLVPLWGDEKGMTAEEIAAKVKRFFRSHAINRHKMTVLTPAYHAVPYSPDDHRHDHRPFLYNATWAYQFAMIDQKLNEIQAMKP